ncbi:hypothetical protein B5S27_g4476 [[Candida] boidinii]|nr:hypothetical protein B5S27_g4476 [[Candida] boidinii]
MLNQRTNLKSGGAYIPPARLRAMLAEAKVSKSSKEYQKLKWDQLKKQLNGLINKANVSNLKVIVVELFQCNLIRGKGAFIRSLMKAQSSALTFTNVYASLICIINSKIPEIGALLITRLILQFRRGYRRSDKVLLKSSVLFLGHLCNQQVCHEILIFQLLHLLLENPTDDSVEISIDLIIEVGLLLEDMSPTANNAIFERLRNILQEDVVSKRTQFLIQDLFELRRKSYQGHEVIPNGLDLVEEDDKVTHTISFDDQLKAEEKLNVFQFDEDYEANEEKYEKLKRDILGESDDESGDDESDDESDESGDESDDNENDDQVKVQVKDFTATELTNYQKRVYLTIMSSMGHDEAVHKLLKLEPIDPDKKEEMLVDMIVKCCAQEKTYSKFFGLIAEKLCSFNRKWYNAFEINFKDYYTNCHRFENNLLRNIGLFWGHLFASDKLGWECMEIVKLTETESNSSNRILLKFIFQKLREELGLKLLKERLEEEYIQPFISGMFPIKGSENLRFSINFFTAIGLGVLTENMRDILQELPDSEEEEEYEEEDQGGEEGGTNGLTTDDMRNERLRKMDEQERGRSGKGKICTGSEVKGEVERSRSSSGSRSGSYSRSRSGSYSRSRSGSYSRSRSGSYSRSRSGSYSRSRSGSYSRSRSGSYSRSCSGSYSRSRSGSYSRSRSGSYSRSRSGSYSRSRSGSRSISQSRSRSGSPAAELPPHLRLQETEQASEISKQIDKDIARMQTQTQTQTQEQQEQDGDDANGGNKRRRSESPIDIFSTLKNRKR